MALPTKHAGSETGAPIPFRLDVSSFIVLPSFFTFKSQQPTEQAETVLGAPIPSSIHIFIFVLFVFFAVNQAAKG
jgi:hypothetical protein